MVVMMCKREFDLDVELDKILASVDRVSEQCGTIAPKYFLFSKGEIGKDNDFELALPCNVYAIEHVASSKYSYEWYGPLVLTEYPDALVNYGIGPDGKWINDCENDVPQVYEVNKNVFARNLGPMVPFQNDNNCCLHFNFRTGFVDVLYRGKIVDERGYPKLPEKTLTALAYWMQYMDVRKKFNMQLASPAQLELAKQEYNQRVAQARVPDSLSANESDDLLNSLVDFNRKQHNLQFRGPGRNA